MTSSPVCGAAITGISCGFFGSTGTNLGVFVASICVSVSSIDVTLTAGMAGLGFGVLGKLVVTCLGGDALSSGVFGAGAIAVLAGVGFVLEGNDSAKLAPCPIFRVICWLAVFSGLLFADAVFADAVFADAVLAAVVAGT